MNRALLENAPRAATASLADVPPAQDGVRSWTVAVAVMACLMLGPSVLLVATFGVFVGPLSEAFGWTRGEIGLAVSLMAASIMVAAPLQGVLLDRYGPRRVVLGSIPMLALGLVGLALLPMNLPLFYGLWASLPFLAVGVWPVAYLKTVSGWFDRHLGKATGLANAGIGLGTILAPPLASAAIAAFGVRGGFLALAAAALLALPLAAIFLRERKAPRFQDAVGVPAWSYRRIFAEPEYRKLVAGFFLIGMTGTGILANLVPILVSKGIAAPQAVGVMAAFGICALGGRLATGWLLDRFHAAPVMCLLAGSTVAALLALALHPSQALAMAAAVSLGLLSGGEFDVLAFTLRRYFGLASFGKMYGAAFSLFQMGAAAGAALLAASVGLTGSYAASLLALAGAVTLSMVLFGRLASYPETDAAAGEV